MSSAQELLQAATTALRARGELAWRGDFAHLDPATPLSTLGIDSIEWINLLLELESLGGFALHNTEMAGIGRISELLELIEQKLQLIVESATNTQAENLASPTLDERIEAKAREIQLIRQDQRYLFHPLMESAAGPRVQIDDRAGVTFASYSYLGLSKSRSAIEGAFAAIEKFGFGPHGSPVLAGYNSLYRDLEERLAATFHTEAACLFSSGYVTNIETIRFLVGRGDRVIGDVLNHTSIVEGCIQSGAKFLTFPHNDLERLHELLRKSQSGRTLVVVDGVYSMEGDVAPIPEISSLCRQYGAKLMVDEAHSFGVIGPSGLGVQDHFSLPPDAIDIKMGTLSKAIGAQGGFICGSQNLVTALKHNAKGYLFSGALPPPILGAALANFQTLLQKPELARQAQLNREKFISLCRERDLPVLHPGKLVAAIVPIMMPSDEIAYEVTKICRKRGLFVVPVIYPAVPKEAPRLRCCVMSNHTEEDLAFAAETIAVAIGCARSNLPARKFEQGGVQPRHGE